MTRDEIEQEYDNMIEALQRHPYVKDLEYAGEGQDEEYIEEQDEETGDIIRMELSRGFTFTAGNIGPSEIIFMGDVRLYINDDYVYGSLFGSLAMDGEFTNKKKLITGEEEAYQADYDPNSKSWDDDFVIDGY